MREMATSTALEPRKIDILLESHKFFLISSRCKYTLSQLYTSMYSMSHFFIQLHYGHTFFFSDKLLQAHRMKLLY